MLSFPAPRLVRFGFPPFGEDEITEKCMSDSSAVRWSSPIFFGSLVVVFAVAAKGEDVSPGNSDPGARPALPRDGRVFADESDRRRLAEMWSADVRRRRIAA